MLLASYAAGGLPRAEAARVAADLALRPDRRAFVGALGVAQGLLLDGLTPVPLADHRARLARILGGDPARTALRFTL